MSLSYADFIQVPLKTPTLPPATHTNCYLLGEKDYVILDPAGKDLNPLLDIIEKRPHKALEIWISHHHHDHIGGVMQLKEILNIPIKAHPYLHQKADHIKTNFHFKDKEIISIGLNKWQVFFTPGHASTHCSFYNVEKKIYYSGDNVVGLGTVLIAPPDENMKTYLNELRKMLDFDIDIMLPAHGPIITNAHQKIRSYINHRLMREESILNALNQKEKDIEELLCTVYPNISDALHDLAKISLLAHLEKLLDDKVIQEKKEKYYIL